MRYVVQVNAEMHGERRCFAKRASASFARTLSPTLVEGRGSRVSVCFWQAQCFTWDTASGHRCKREDERAASRGRFLWYSRGRHAEQNTAKTHKVLEKRASWHGFAPANVTQAGYGTRIEHTPKESVLQALRLSEHTCLALNLRGKSKGIFESTAKH